MKETTFKQALIALLKVKSIITITIIGVVSYLAIQRVVDPAVFTGIAASVVTYYFSRREEGDK